MTPGPLSSVTARRRISKRRDVSLSQAANNAHLSYCASFKTKCSQLSHRSALFLSPNAASVCCLIVLLPKGSKHREPPMAVWCRAGEPAVGTMSTLCKKMIPSAFLHLRTAGTDSFLAQMQPLKFCRDCFPPATYLPTSTYRM